MSVNSQTNRHPGLRFGAKVRRQDKSADRRRAHVVGWVGFFDTSAIPPAGAFDVKVNDFNVASAIRALPAILLDRVASI